MTDDIRIPFHEAVNLDGRSIEVLIGSEPRVAFSVHESLICETSDFFANAMSPKWEESNSRVVILEEDDPDIFRIYLHWLYRGALPVKNEEPGHAGNSEYLQLAKAYILADKIQDGNFRDTVIDAMMDKCRSRCLDGKTWFPVGPVIRCIYENTREQSKARRLLVHMYATNGSSSWLTEWANPDDLSKDFLLELAVALLDKEKGTFRNPVSGQRTCEYHEHGSDPLLCYKNRRRNVSAGRVVKKNKAKGAC